MAALENQRHEKFAQGLIQGMSADAAASAAGYQPKPCDKGLKGFYVYALIGSDGKPFYIGKGTRMRFDAHLRLWRKDKLRNVKVAAGFDAACAAGVSVEHLCIQDDLTEEAAFAIERRLIRALGFNALANARPGQVGNLEQELHRAIDFYRRIKPFDEWFMATKGLSMRDCEVYATVKRDLCEIIDLIENKIRVFQHA